MLNGGKNNYVNVQLLRVLAKTSREPLKTEYPTAVTTGTMFFLAQWRFGRDPGFTVEENQRSFKIVVRYIPT